jgi:hypothetical protein
MMSPNKNLNYPGEQLKPFSPRVQSCPKRGVEVEEQFKHFSPKEQSCPKGEGA